MNRLLIVILLVCCQASYAQTLPDDTLPGVNHEVPLCIANGVIVRVDELNPDFIDSIYVDKDRESKKYGNIANNGVILLYVRQSFDVITPDIYRNIKLKGATGKVVYALNGYLLTDTTSKISKAAIRKVEVLKEVQFASMDKPVTCISLWTLTDEERHLPVPKGTIRIRGNNVVARN